MKGIMVFLLSFLNLLFFLLELHIIDSSSIIIKIFFVFNIGLIFNGIYIYLDHKVLHLLHDVINIVMIFVLSMILIIFTGKVASNFFPVLLLSPLIYSALIKKRWIFWGANVIVLSIIAFYTIMNHFFIFHLKSSRMILEFILYFSIVFVIRSYQSDCLSCTLEPNSCPKQDSCALYQATWNRKGEEYASIHTKSREN